MSNNTNQIISGPNPKVLAYAKMLVERKKAVIKEVNKSVKENTLVEIKFA